MADDCRQWSTDRYGQGRYSFVFVEATASLAGIEVASVAYGNASWERDFAKPLDAQLDTLADDAVREVLAVAPEAVADVAQAKEASAAVLRVMADNLRIAYQEMAT
jgi:hypothetical protein